jgi:hypothetical protein
MENNTTPSQPKITTPYAIIIAGFLIMVGILLTKGTNVQAQKTLSEQVGVSKEKLAQCVKVTNLDEVYNSIMASVDKAMSHIPKDQRGTPYSIVIGPNGFMTDVRGAATYEQMSQVVASAREEKLAEVVDGTKTVTITELYKGTVTLSEPTDHILGNPNAPITIIEYSDFECPYCKQFQPVMERIIKESPDVKWVYRNYPLHQHSFEKLVAAECVAKIKGNDAYWKYGDLLFGLLKTGDDSVTEQL